MNRVFAAAVVIVVALCLCAMYSVASAAPKSKGGTTNTNIPVPGTVVAAPVACPEPMTSPQCFATAKAPCIAPKTGPMSPGCTYVGKLVDGRETRFLFQTDQTGYAYTPIYGRRIRRTATGAWELL